MNPKLFLNVLAARFWVIALILAATVAIAAFVTSRTPPRYKAVTTVVLDVLGRNPFESVGVPRSAVTGYQATQVDIIMSPRVALRAVDRLSPEMKVIAIKAFQIQQIGTQNGSAIRKRLAYAFQRDLKVRLSGASQVLALEVTSPHPRLAAATADAIARAYMNVALDLQISPARRNARWFEGQLKKLRAQIEEDQRLMTAYQRDKEIVSVDERLDVETRRYQELSSALVVAQTNRYDVESRQLGSQHPEYLRAVERERFAQASLSRQRARVLETQKQRDELNLMASELENSRKTYDETLQQFNQSRLYGQFTETNVAILSEAAIPSDPSSPNVLINMTLATLLGVTLGVLAALLLELLNRRVRIAEDVSHGLGVPVLATLRAGRG